MRRMTRSFDIIASSARSRHYAHRTYKTFFRAPPIDWLGCEASSAGRAGLSVAGISKALAMLETVLPRSALQLIANLPHMIAVCLALCDRASCSRDARLHVVNRPCHAFRNFLLLVLVLIAHSPQNSMHRLSDAAEPPAHINLSQKEEGKREETANCNDVKQ